MKLEIREGDVWREVDGVTSVELMPRDAVDHARDTVVSIPLEKLIRVRQRRTLASFMGWLERIAAEGGFWLDPWQRQFLARVFESSHEWRAPRRRPATGPRPEGTPPVVWRRRLVVASALRRRDRRTVRRGGAR